MFITIVWRERGTAGAEKAEVKLGVLLQPWLFTSGSMVHCHVLCHATLRERACAAAALVKITASQFRHHDTAPEDHMG